MAKTHPHIDAPTREQLCALVQGRPEPLQHAYLGLHQLIIDTLPDISVSVDEVDHVIGYGSKQYGYNGWGMLAVRPFSRWVSLTFMQGTQLDPAPDLLVGTSTMRHFTTTSSEGVALHRPDLIALVTSAAQLYTQTDESL